MTTFTQHVEDYLRLRRSLGFKLKEHARRSQGSPRTWMRSAPNTS